MVRLRAIAAALVLAGVVAPTTALASSLSVSRGNPFGGFARDAAGRAIADVEIILLDERQRERPVATVVTDATGRFLIPSLPPGLYLVAALKNGYVASIGRVNTVLRSTLDLVLRPAPRAGEPGVEPTRDAAWALRAPSRSILRETESSTLADTALPATRGRQEGETIAGRLEHLVPVAGWSAAGAGATSNVQGGTTILGLGGSLGERGNLRFEGSRDRFSTPADRGTATPAVDRESTALAVDFDYPTGHGAQLAMKAYYSRRNLESGLDGTVGPDREVERSNAWGYDARWTRQVDADATVAVRVGFADASLDLPERSEAGDVVVRRGLNRAVGAEGSFESEAGAGHRLAVGVRADILDLSDPSVRSGYESLLAGISSAPGWSVRLRAEDAWSISAPVTLSYGVAVHQVFGDSDATMLTPTIGAGWRNDVVRVSASGTYHAVSVQTTGAGGAGAFRPRRALGYDAEFEARLPDGTVCRGRYAYAPVQFDRSEGAGAFEEEIFATDGNAADRRAGFAVERPFRGGSVLLELYGGRAEGNLAEPGSSIRPVLIFDERVLEYRAGRLGARIDRSGTHVSLEYRRLAEGPRRVEAEPLVEAFLELQLAQEVLRLRRLGASCRLLLAARTPTGSVGPETAAAFNNRIRAGLAVSF